MRAPEFWSRNDLCARWIGAGLAPLGWVYGASVAYKSARARPYRARAQVICVGNLTVGGTGKTPLALVIHEMLRQSGRRPVFLSRGYGGVQRGPLLVDPADMTAAEVGDEPLLLARHGAVIVARDRGAGARLADTMGFDAIVMDDGHQNFALAKDLSLVVIDGESGFGNGRLVPAGPLRETLTRGLARADAAIVIGGTAPDLGSYREPVLHGAFVADCASWKGRRAVAFAGIGRPQKFFTTLRACGVDLAECVAFADHHPYTADELACLARTAKRHDAMLITTEKDYVRLMPEQRAGICVLAIKMQLREPERLQSLIDRAQVRS